MSSRYASSTVLSFLGLRKIGRIDKDWYHAFWKKGNSFISCCMPSNESSIWESFPFPKGLVNGVEIGYGQSPITRIGIREPSRCVLFPTRERRLLSRVYSGSEKSSIFWLENELLAKHREGVSLTRRKRESWPIRLPPLTDTAMGIDLLPPLLTQWTA